MQALMLKGFCADVAMVIALVFVGACSQSSPPVDTQEEDNETEQPFSLQPDFAQEYAIIKTYSKSIEFDVDFEKRFAIPEFDRARQLYSQDPDATPMIDILIVIDNSGSMEDEQLNLASKLDPILSSIRSTNWLINVITTEDPCRADPRLPVSPDNPDYRELFFQGVNVGAEGDANEKGFDMAVYHLLGKPYSTVGNPGSLSTPDLTPVNCAGSMPWRRQEEGAKLAVLFVTDEPNYSEAEYDDRSFTKAVEDMGYVVGTDAKFFGLINNKDGTCPADTRGADQYIAAIENSGGFHGSICSDDYSRTLSRISEDISEMLLTEIELTFMPRNPPDMLLNLDGDPFPYQWVLEDDRLIISAPLEPGVPLNISYRHQGVNELVIGQPLDPKRLSVEIEGDARDIAWEMGATGDSLQFYEDLPEGAAIRVTSLAAEEPVRYFKLPSDVGEVIDCFLTEKAESDDARDDSETEIDFESLKVSDKSIIINWQYREGSNEVAIATDQLQQNQKLHCQYRIIE